MAKGGRRRQHGEGSLHHRASDGYWVATAELGRSAGRRVRRSFYGATPEQARAKRAEFLRDRDAGFERPAGKGETTGAWLDYWLDQVATISDTTRPDYASKIRIYMRPAIGHIRLGDLDEAAIEAMYARMRRQGLSPATVTKTHAILHAALRAATARRRMIRNPCGNITIRAGSKPDLTPPDASDAGKILRAARGTRGEARWLTGLAMGLRQGEALGLLWPMVDLDAGTMSVAWQLKRLPWAHGCGDPAGCARLRCRPACKPGCRRKAHLERGHPKPCRAGCTGHASSCPRREGGGLVLRRPKSEKSRATLPMPPQLTAALRAHRKAQAAERLAGGDRYGWAHDPKTCTRKRRPREEVCPACGKPSERGLLVFATADGRPVDLRRDWGEWAALCQQAGVAHYRVHDGRHFAATAMLELGADSRIVQAVMRHADSRTTSGYAHVSTGLAADAVGRAADRLWKELGT